MIRPAVIHTLQFEVPGKLESKANFRRSGKGWRDRWSRIKTFEASVGTCAILSGAKWAYDRYAENPIRMEVILFNQPKSMDLDGAQKSLWDALESVAYENDRQVQSCEIARMYDADGPRTRVRVRYLEAEVEVRKS